uniref:Uncharacterized protein n=1 Tax=Rhizophora mucronata TaxID=61149 RepID=A0A2P2IUK1_RHIMU
MPFETFSLAGKDDCCLCFVLDLTSMEDD